MKKKDNFKSDFENEVQHNDLAFQTLLKNVRPDVWVIMDLLDETKISPVILLKAMRHLNNIAQGSRYGTVTVYIENGVATFVRGEESDRLNEKVILED